MGCPFLNTPIRRPVKPITEPYKQAKKKANNTPFMPRAKPSTAKSLISPPPIFPRLIIAIAVSSPNPINTPKRQSSHGW